MNFQYIDYNRIADTEIIDQTKRSDVLSLALALAISNTLHIPTTAVEGPESYFNLQIIPLITKTISEFGQNMILDQKQCLEHTRMFWLLRYTAAYPNSQLMYSPAHDFFDTIFGVSLFVAPETHALLDGPNKNAILGLARFATNMIEVKE